MGTLFEQKPRKTIDIHESIQEIAAVVHQSKTPTEITLKIIELAIELESLKCLQEDRDVKDEQLSGFGELLRDISEALSNNNEL